MAEGEREKKREKVAGSCIYPPVVEAVAAVSYSVSQTEVLASELPWPQG